MLIMFCPFPVIIFISSSSGIFRTFDGILVYVSRSVYIVYTMLGDVCIYVVGKDEYDELACKCLSAELIGSNQILESARILCFYLLSSGRGCVCDNSSGEGCMRETPNWTPLPWQVWEDLPMPRWNCLEGRARWHVNHFYLKMPACFFIITSRSLQRLKKVS